MERLRQAQRVEAACPVLQWDGAWASPQLALLICSPFRPLSSNMSFSEKYSKSSRDLLLKRGLKRHVVCG